MNLTLEDFARQLEEVSGASAIDPDTPLAEVSDVDSMDLMEWLYKFQTENPGSGVDAAVFENEDGRATLRTFHTRLVSVVA
jgi:hypothetical protein